MKWTRVVSSCLAGYYYARKSRILVVEFKDGQKALYREVPWQIYCKLVRAKSKGSYFQNNIATKYDFQYIESIPVKPEDDLRDMLERSLKELTAKQ